MINNKCNKCNESFITDVAELCTECPVLVKINDVRGKMIKRTELIKAANTSERYAIHLRERIEECNQTIESTLNTENNDSSKYRQNRVSLYLSHKDCIAYYNNELDLLKNGEIPANELLQETETQKKEIMTSCVYPTKEEVKILKPIFDKLTYPEKLKFWYDKNYGIHNVTQLLIEIDDVNNQHRKPENYFTIFPHSEEERALYNDWLLTNVQNENRDAAYTFDKLQEAYFHTIKESPLPLEHTKKEIERIKAQFEQANKLKVTAYKGYIIGYDSTISQDKKHLTMDSSEFQWAVCEYAKGIEAAHYMGFLEKQLIELQNPETMPNKSTKLKWLGTPSQFGWLFFELAKKGYIEFPLRSGEINPTGFAKMCFDLFEIDTTKENLIKEINRNKNTLSDTKRAKFTIPEIKDLL